MQLNQKYLKIFVTKVQRYWKNGSNLDIYETFVTKFKRHWKNGNNSEIFEAFCDKSTEVFGSSRLRLFPLNVYH